MTDEQWLNAALDSAAHYLSLANDAKTKEWADRYIAQAEGVLDFIHFQITRTNIHLTDVQQERYARARERC